MVCRCSHRRGSGGGGKGGYSRTKKHRGRKKTTGNPWAICKWMGRKHHWPKAKTERCILKIKKKKGYRRASISRSGKFPKGYRNIRKTKGGGGYSETYERVKRRRGYSRRR